MMHAQGRSPAVMIVHLDIAVKGVLGLLDILPDDKWICLQLDSD